MVNPIRDYTRGSVQPEKTTRTKYFTSDVHDTCALVICHTLMRNCQGCSAPVRESLQHRKVQSSVFGLDGQCLNSTESCTRDTRADARCNIEVANIHNSSKCGQSLCSVSKVGVPDRLYLQYMLRIGTCLTCISNGAFHSNHVAQENTPKSTRKSAQFGLGLFYLAQRTIPRNNILAVDSQITVRLDQSNIDLVND